MKLAGATLATLAALAAVGCSGNAEVGETTAAKPRAPTTTAAKNAPAGTTTTPAKKPPAQHFESRPDLRPPPVKVLTAAHGTAPGYIFIGPKREVDQAGPLILDDAGQVVWFRTLDTKGVTDFRVQTYRGQPVLTWWRGESEKGVGNGRYVVMDDSYRVIADVRAGRGLSGDIHEFLITRRNTALISIYRTVKRDLTAFGGPADGAFKEGVVQEVDIASGRVLFEWHSWPRVGLAESYEGIPKGEDRGDDWDYFHLNAIDVDDDGNLLLSARHTHAIYKVRKSDGAIMWRLGGKRSDFTLGKGASFAWQHDIRRQPDGTLTLFDNGASRPPEKTAPQPHSRVLVLRLDPSAKRAELVRSYAHPRKLLSTSQGNAQFLLDGHVLVGWGSNRYVTEFDRAGNVLLDLTFGSGEADSYRAYRAEWVGHPTDRPAVFLSERKAYVSWNGATEVTRWRVLDIAGKTVAEAPKREFETSISLPSNDSVRVVALGADGRELGRSALTRSR
jgi:hypothetical protein